MSDQLQRALDRAAPHAPVPVDRAARAVLAGRRFQRRRRLASTGVIAVAVATVVALPASLGWFRGGDSNAPLVPQGDLDQCTSDRSHTDLSSGTAVLIRFCRPATTWNGVVHVPTIPLTDGVESLVEGWSTGEPTACEFDPASDAFRFQVVYDDGSVAQVTGATGNCQPAVNGRTTLALPGLEVFSQVLQAYAEQLGADFNSAPDRTRLSCPADPRHPETTDRSGPSDQLSETGLVIPLPIEVGLLCVDARPYRLDHIEIEQVQVALQTITTGRLDCESPNSTSTNPTSYSLVLEDKSGTRRTISTIGAECGAVVSGFPGGPSGNPGDYLPRVLERLAN
jgi:hypothetical protein